MTTVTGEEAALPQLIWSFRPDGRVGWCNRRCADYSGLGDERFGEALSPADLARLRDRFGRPDDSSFWIELPVRRSDGAWRWHLGRAVRLDDDDGQQLLVAAIDIDDRKRAEQRLSVQYLTARILSEHAPFETVLARILEALGQSAGWKLAECWIIERQRLRHLRSWHSPSLSRVEPFLSLSRTMSLGAGEGLPGRVWATGQSAWCPDLTRDPGFIRGGEADSLGLRSAFAFPIAGGGSMLGVLVFFSDHFERPDERLLETIDSIGRQLGQYMERKRAEAALAHREAELRMILDSVDAMVWYKDAHNRILRCNRAAASSIGRSVAELEGADVRELYPDEAERYHKDDLEVIRSGCPKLAIVEPLRAADGSRRWVRTDKIPYRDQNGDIIGVIVFAVDITESKRAEEVLLESERSQREFVANVSHELRTPVAAIKGFAETLRRGALSDRRNNMRFVRIIENHADRLSWLIQDLLTLSALEAGRLEPEPIDLSPFIEEYLQSIAPLSRDAKIAVEARLARGLVIEADRKHLLQVLENLVSNAIKFNRPGGKVWVDAARSEHGVRLSVRDNGNGIGPDHVGRIFERFYKAGPPDARGTGLGLHIVQRIVQAHGGRISVESKLGRGTVFHAQLPLKTGLRKPGPVLVK